MNIENLSSNKSFGGWHKRYSHYSSCLNCSMRFAIYLPPQASSQHPVPALYWLSGLTCNEENFMQKAAAQRVAAELGIALVAPDTSPRGEAVPDDADASYDLGWGAGFYVNATQAPWQQHYQMYDYVLNELPALLQSLFPLSGRRAISGHSMGGHGALVLALRNPELYSSVSAFSPIANPVNCAWGQKAFSAYLGADRRQWQAYDASALIAQASARVPMLIDQGEADEFLAQQLLPQNLLEAAASVGYPLQYRLHPGYDHSYYFIASFIEEHLRFHARHLSVLL